MAYSKTNWVNDSSPFINAGNLNKIEDGILNNDAYMSSLSNRTAALQSTANNTQNLITLLSDTITSAKNTADAAKDAAQLAQGRSNTAVSTANDAKNTSDAALEKANHADTQAGNAVSMMQALSAVDGVPSAVYSAGYLIITSGNGQ